MHAYPILCYLASPTRTTLPNMTILKNIVFEHKAWDNLSVPPN